MYYNPSAIADGHNPAGLTNAQVGIGQGYRLLDKDEIIAIKNEQDVPVMAETEALAFDIFATLRSHIQDIPCYYAWFNNTIYDTQFCYRTKHSRDKIKEIIQLYGKNK